MFHRLLIATTLLLALAGCGQKGPLYLPESAPAKPAEQKPAQPQPPST